MFRFLHAADIHLDSPLEGLDRYEGAPADEIRGATRRALENLVTLALDERVDFVVVAGDLYDGDWEDFRTGLFFVRQMARLHEAGVPAVIVAGNHDAKNDMTHRLPLPKSVALFLPGEPGTVRLEGCKAAVHGQSFGQKAVKSNLAAGYPPAVPGWFNIGLLHTSLTDREGHDRYAPCGLDDLKSKEYDYWALGHIHKAEQICTDPPVVYPGNVQGRHVRETGAKGCLLVTVDDRRRPSVEHRPLDVLRWEICRVDASGAQTEDELLDRVQRGLAAAAAGAGGRPVAARVRIEGATPLHCALTADPEYWTNQVRAVSLTAGGEVWVEKVVGATRPPTAAVRSEWSDLALGELLGYLDEVRSSPEARAALADEVKEFVARLPSELRGRFALGDAPGESPGLPETLAEVEQLLIHRLGEQEARP